MTGASGDVGAANRPNAAFHGRYHIERELGTGGMATVYLAEDLRHNRKVAIKVLKPELAALVGAERFLAEIKTTANLQHPHILPLFDSGEADGFLFYVMPYVEGETLRDRLEREKQLPVDEAVKIASDVAEALHAAHEQGVIHRDIKPANILLSKGRPLVADFGIALAVSASGGGRLTETGLSLGTPYYMSPEQASADREPSPASDVYSLGCVLYEMLVGEPPYTGATAQAVLVKILMGEVPEPTEMRASIPPNVDAAVRKAVEKLPADRFKSAQEFARALADPGYGRSTGSGALRASSKPRSRGARIAPWLVAAAAVIVAVVTNMPRGSAREASPTGPVFTYLDFEGAGLGSPTSASFDLSSDGRRVAIVVDRGDDRGLAVRSLDSIGVRFLARTRGALFPFWAPDGRSIGFLADDSLKVIDLTSGIVRSLCAAVGSQGGSWAPDGSTILVGAGGERWVRADPTDGTCTETPLVAASAAFSRSHRPYFLPDSRHFVATTDMDAWLGELGNDTLTKLIDLGRAQAVLLPPDYLLFHGVDGEVVQRIDIEQGRLTGEPIGVLPRVPNGGGHTAVSASRTNLVAVFRVEEVPEESRVGSDPEGAGLVWVDPLGQRSDVASGGGFGPVRVSRDGSRIARGGWNVRSTEDGVAWVRVGGSVESGVWTASDPLWAPSDTAIAFLSGEVPEPAIRVVSLRSGEERELATVPFRGAPSASRVSALMDWSPDGNHIAFLSTVGAESTEAWEYDLVADSARRLFQVPGDVGELRYGPTGEWLAYQVVTGGEADVFLRSYPGAAPPVQVSSGRGEWPRWNGDGTALFYRDSDGAVVSRTVAPGPSVTLGPPEITLGPGVAGPGQAGKFEVAPDGRRFLVTLRRPTAKLSLVLDWPKLLEGR